MAALGSAQWHFDSFPPSKEQAFQSGVGFGDVYDGGNGYVGLPTKRHFLTVAATRSGKGTSLIIPNLLHYAGSVIVIDPKGENAWDT